MTIAFICGSLEHGRDGVGDYVRALASAVAAAGHNARVAAIHDRYIHCGSDSIESVNELRLSPSETWEKRAAQLSAWLGATPTEWMSWQLVPYGLHPKGVIPAAARRALSRFSSLPSRRHVMLHELWIGLSAGEPRFNRLMGWLQRRSLLHLLAVYRPEVLHTSNPTYGAALAAVGYRVGILPLPGNVSPLTVSEEESRVELMHALELDANAPRPLTALIFGTVHPQWAPHDTMEWLRRAATAAKRRLALLFVGHLGIHGDRVANSLSGLYPDVLVRRTGLLSSPVISQLMQASDFGIGLHPWALIGKSGAVAAMLDHGLPVLVPRDDWTLRKGQMPAPELDPLLTRPCDTDPADVLSWLACRRRPVARVDRIATRFMASLNHCASTESFLSL